MDESWLVPERALCRTAGEWSGTFHAPHRYAVTVYGVGDVYEFQGRQEYRNFVAVVEWDPPGYSGPQRDADVLRKAARDMGYLLAPGVSPRPIDKHRAFVQARAIFKT